MDLAPPPRGRRRDGSIPAIVRLLEDVLTNEVYPAFGWRNRSAMSDALRWREPAHSRRGKCLRTGVTIANLLNMAVHPILS
jgi:hypothetical protein